MTPRFVETEALLAVLEGDEEHCVKLLGDMLPSELRNLQLAASRLRSLAADAYVASRLSRLPSP